MLIFSGRQNDAGTALAIGLPGLLKKYFSFNNDSNVEEFSILADGGYGVCQQVKEYQIFLFRCDSISRFGV